MSAPRFIVVFKDHATPEQVDQYARRIDESGGQVGTRYDTVLKGFSAAIPESLFQSLQGDDIIDYIEPDGIVTTQ